MKLVQVIKNSLQLMLGQAYKDKKIWHLYYEKWKTSLSACWATSGCTMQQLWAMTPTLYIMICQPFFHLFTFIIHLSLIAWGYVLAAWPSFKMSSVWRLWQNTNKTVYPLAAKQCYQLTKSDSRPLAIHYLEYSRSVDKIGQVDFSIGRNKMKSVLNIFCIRNQYMSQLCYIVGWWALTSNNKFSKILNLLC